MVYVGIARSSHCGLPSTILLCVQPTCIPQVATVKSFHPEESVERCDYKIVSSRIRRRNGQASSDRRWRVIALRMVLMATGGSRNHDNKADKLSLQFGAWSRGVTSLGTELFVIFVRCAHNLISDWDKIHCVAHSQGRLHPRLPYPVSIAFSFTVKLFVRCQTLWSCHN